MARLPLSVSKAYPNGRTQPYVLVGPTIFVATYTDPGGHFFPQGQKDTDTSVGLTAGAGLTFMVTPSSDLFTEYRFTHFSPQFRVTTDDFGFVVPAKVRLDANTHRVLFGISYHFNLFGG
ncbi:MAG: outer membrane beta-barrel protein [Deltaproteobacteria bacterium]|nr:outer membrane beta-barrel protein [Deltaproteobacteria bacterium]